MDTNLHDADHGRVPRSRVTNRRKMASIRIANYRRRRAIALAMGAMNLTSESVVLSFLHPSRAATTRRNTTGGLP